MRKFFLIILIASMPKVANSQDGKLPIIDVHMHGGYTYSPHRGIELTGIQDSSLVSYEDKISVYEGLLKKLREDHLLESYQALDIEYRQLQYTNAGTWIISFFQNWWWNYGYNKGWIFYWISGLVSIFTAINVRLLEPLYLGIYEIEFLNLKERPIVGHWDRLWNAFVYTLFIFLWPEDGYEQF